VRQGNNTASLITALLLATAAAMPAPGAERSAGKSDSAEVTGPVWPKPPEPARIRYLKSIDGASDWGLARSWFGRAVDTVTGRHEAQFVRPTSVAEQDGVLYIADPGAPSVVVFDTPRHKELRITRLGDKALVSPVAVTPGPQGTVFVADSYLRQVLQLDANGKLLRTIAHVDLQRPSSLAFDASRRRLYVGDSKAHVIHVFDDLGQKIASFGGLGSGPGQFNSPTHMALLPDGDIVVTDALNFRIEAFGADGQVKYQFGKIGDGAGNFAAPKGVAIDREGHVYVADAMFNAVQVFDAQGRLLLGFGEQGTQAGQFWIPNGLYIDAKQQLFVADAYNRRIQVFQIVPGSSPVADVERGAQP
jgi:DNA-binding beta-propeller fold protein YncE